MRAAHIGEMARWLRIVLVVAGIMAGWMAIGVLTLDDNVRIDYRR